MRFLSMAAVMGMSGLLGACVTQQPAKVVNGLGGRNTSLQPMVRATPAQTPVQQIASSTPPVLLDPPATIQSEKLADIAPAAGPIERPVVQKVAPAAVAQPEPTIVTHTVLPSDTAYKIARKYNTSVDRILSDNNLKSMTEIKEGQTLQIAQNSKPQTSAWDDMKKMLNEAADPNVAKKQVAEATAPQPVTQVAELPKAIVDIEPAAGESPQIDRKVAPQQQAVAKVEEPQFVEHTVEPKETIYRISLKYHVSVLDIMAANDFSEPQDLKADTVIKVPVKTADSKAEAPVQVASLSKPDVVSDVPAPLVSAPRDAVDPKVAEALRGSVNAEAARSKGMVWPVKGKIVKKFGDDGHGVAQTGVNIAVPAGTSVLASDAGTVLYADDGLKIYGKLVLIRHDSGMVSAYAHNGYLLVKKNEKVKKGQVIALSGASGNVDEPQLHFEVRQHASAVDPIAMLHRMQ